jgi:hypothetical protein
MSVSLTPLMLDELISRANCALEIQLTRLRGFAWLRRHFRADGGR